MVYVFCTLYFGVYSAKGVLVVEGSVTEYRRGALLNANEENVHDGLYETDPSSDITTSNKPHQNWLILTPRESLCPEGHL